MKTNNSIKSLIGSASLAVLLITASSSSYAQTYKARFGIKGGVNLSQLYIDQTDVDKEHMKVGLNAGIYAIAPINKYFSIQPELLYSSAGTKVSYKGSNLLGIQGGEVRFNLNYIQLPLLASLNLGVVSIQAGPYFSYLVNANVADLKNDGTVGNTKTLNNDDFNRFDYGFTGGVALNISAVQIGARYNYGLNEIGKSDFAQSLTRHSKNGVAQVYIGLGFGK